MTICGNARASTTDHAPTIQDASLRATEQPVDPSMAAGEAFLGGLSEFGGFETNLRHERPMKGIAAAKDLGVCMARKPTIDPGETRRRPAEERLSPTAIARPLGIARSSVYRVLPVVGATPTSPAEAQA